MNKLTKLMLASAMMITSGFASDISGGIEVSGTYNQNENASVKGLIEVQSGGTFNNAAKLTFSDGGGIEIAAGVEAAVEDYETAYDAYCAENSIPDSNRIPTVGTYPPGSVRGVGEIYMMDWDNVMDKQGIDGSDWGLYYDTDNARYYLSNNVLLDTAPKSLPTSFVWVITGGDGDLTGTINVSWTCTPQSADDYVAEVKKVIGDLSTQAGVFSNASGHLELTSATSSNFSGKISGGQITLTDGASKFASLVVDDVTANYSYKSADTYSEPGIGADNYITVTFTAGKNATEAQSECLGKFADGSTITTFKGTADTSGVTDNRKDFPGILADSTLNSTENKLKTADIPTAIKNYNAANGLDVSAAINIQFEGSDDLMFANGGTAKVIEFKGVNTAYEGTASFADAIVKVHANGANTLPKKLASGMGNITVEITGENTIDNGGTVESPVSTAIKSLKVNSGGKLKVAAGTTLTVGKGSQTPA